MKRSHVGFLVSSLCCVFVPLRALCEGSPDIRRDATVLAVEQVMPCVVNIATETFVDVHDFYDIFWREFYGNRVAPRQERSVSLGSGVIINEDGDVLTNLHVTQRASRIQVKLWDGREYEATLVVGTPGQDVGLLKLKAKPGEKFKAIKLAPEDDLLLGETVLALGNPFGLGGSVTRGILSSKTRRPASGNEPLDINDWLQTDAAINPGNSGGPLINLRGELIGLNVAVYREGQGIGFAIPVKQIASAVAAFFSPETAYKLWFGAHIKPGSDPVLITEVQPGGPAEKSGLRGGDRVLQINGRVPKGFLDFDKMLGETPGHKATLLVERENQRQTLNLVLMPFEEMIKMKAGFTLSTNNPTGAGNFTVQGATGMYVDQIEKNGPAERAELQPGYLVTEVDGVPASDLRAVGSVFAGKSKGDRVRLTVAAQRQIGRGFVQYRQGTLDLEVR
jgi:S1-C subfamily serine protease